MTITTESSTDGAIILSRMNFSGDVGRVTILSWMFTTACCLVVGLGLGLGLGLDSAYIVHKLLCTRIRAYSRNCCIPKMTCRIRNESILSHCDRLECLFHRRNVVFVCSINTTQKAKSAETSLSLLCKLRYVQISVDRPNKPCGHKRVGLIPNSSCLPPASPPPM